MAKVLSKIQLVVRDTSVPGSPDEVEVYYRVNDSEDSELNKHKSYIVSSPDFDSTIQSFWNTQVAYIQSEEGIS